MLKRIAVLSVWAGAFACAAGARTPRHGVVVIEENHAFTQIIGSRDCPTFNRLAAQGALLTDCHALTHPSEPNYLALFAGRLFGSPPDTCPPPGSPYRAPNLASLLLDSGRTFVGYSEGLPQAGSPVCADADPNGYRRKHNPWVDFAGLPGSVNLPFTAFPRDFDRLPDLAFVVPDLRHDMHNGSPAEADAWLRDNLGAYARWCATHDAFLMVTWDEDNGTEGNRIPTFFVGRPVRPGRYRRRADTYTLLRTLCDLYRLRAPGGAAQAKPLRGVFRELP